MGQNSIFKVHILIMPSIQKTGYSPHEYLNKRQGPFDTEMGIQSTEPFVALDSKRKLFPIESTW